MASAGSMPGYFRQKKSRKSSTSKKAGSKSSPTNVASIGSNITQPPALLAHGSLDLQEDRSKDEEVLRHFDMNMAYGPCLGMSRAARWDRAQKLGLNPPREVEVLLKSGRVVHAQAQEVELMRRQLTDENYIYKPSTSASQDNGTSLQEVRTPRKTAASIAAEVADKLAASTSSQLIMTSVLSSFTADEAKNAGFTKISPSTEKLVMLVPSPAVNLSYSPTIIPPQAVSSHIPTSQPLYQILPNHSTQPYVQPAGPAVASYGFVNFPTSQGLSPQPQMVSPLVTAPPGFQQMAPNQTLTLPQPAVPVPPQPPFRPLQIPQIMYYALQHHPQL